MIILQKLDKPYRPYYCQDEEYNWQVTNGRFAQLFTDESKAVEFKDNWVAGGWKFISENLSKMTIKSSTPI